MSIAIRQFANVHVIFLVIHDHRGAWRRPFHPKTNAPNLTALRPTRYQTHMKEQRVTAPSWAPVDSAISVSLQCLSCQVSNFISIMIGTGAKSRVKRVLWINEWIFATAVLSHMTDDLLVLKEEATSSPFLRRRGSQLTVTKIYSTK